MRQLHHYFFSVLISAASVILASCGRYDENFGSKKTLKSEDLNSDFDSENQRKIASESFMATGALASPIAGLAQLGNSKTPVVFFPDVKNDYVFFQVARCKHDAFESETIKSWAEVSSHCTVVFETHPQVPFFDLSAPSGHWRWVTRACMSLRTQQPSVCHENIMPTKNSVIFERKNVPRLDNLTTSVHQRKISINSLTDTIQLQTLELGLAYQQCDLATWKKAENLIKRSIIANIIGYGAALLIKVYSKEILNSMNPQSTWQDRFNSLWNEETSDQKAIVRTLLWLFTSKDDFFESCTHAQKIKIEANFNLIRLREQQLLLAEDLDQLKTVGVEIGEAVLQ